MKVQAKTRGKRFKFTGKKQSKKGIAAFLLALVSWITGIVCVFLAFMAHGEGSIYLGSAGLFAMFLAIAAVGLASSGRKEEKSFQLFPLLGLGVGLTALICWFAIFMLGSLT